MGFRQPLSVRADDVLPGTLTGSTIQTAATGRRIVLTASPSDPLTLKAYTGDPDESAPGVLAASVADYTGGGTPPEDQGRLSLFAPLIGASTQPAYLDLLSDSRDGGASELSAAVLGADQITIGSPGAIAAGHALALSDANGLTLAGVPIRPMTTGRVAVVTDTNGYATIAHGLGRIPDHVSLGICAPLCATDDLARLAVPCQYYAPSSTLLAVRFRRIDTGAWFSGVQTIGLQWSAA